jgi:segregation and condensation protein A
MQEDYKVQLDVFEGPLDLLLYLIRREEVDIYNIPIRRITEQYMEYLGLMRMLDLNIAGEFLVMAATLMMIKSRMLIPEDRIEEMEEEEEDPRWDLVRQLVEYKKFKDAAGRLESIEAIQSNVFGLGHEAILLDGDPGLAVEDVSLFDLISAFSEALKNARDETLGEIIAETFTVADKIDLILREVKRRGTIRFSDLFPGESYRAEMVCTFLGLLELIRLRHVEIRQDGVFGEIFISGVAGESSLPHESPDEQSVPAEAGEAEEKA